MTPNKIYEKICNSPYKVVGRDVNYYFEVDDKNKKVYLYLQGSNSKIDVLVDLNAFIKMEKIGRTKIAGHWGFIKAFKTAIETIMEEWKSLNKKNYKLIICGHSMGAAYSILAYFYFKEFMFKESEVYTFGAPRILTCGTVRKLNLSEKCIIEFCNNNDIISKIPFWFKHINKIKVGEKFNLFKCLFHPIKYHLHEYLNLDYGEFDI